MLLLTFFSSWAQIVFFLSKTNAKINFVMLRNVFRFKNCPLFDKTFKAANGLYLNWKFITWRIEKRSSISFLVLQYFVNCSATPERHQKVLDFGCNFSMATVKTLKKLRLPVISIFWTYKKKKDMYWLLET